MRSNFNKEQKQQIVDAYFQSGKSQTAFAPDYGIKANTLSNSVFFFCNKNHKLLKIIFWNKTGFWLAQKRLEQATWPWPNTSQEAREINTEQFEMLLAGIDFWCAHEEIKFNSVF